MRGSPPRTWSGSWTPCGGPSPDMAARAALVSVVLACYNEEEILLSSFAEIKDTLDGLGRPYEIVFVDDASRDRTRELISQIVAAHPATAMQVVLHEKNRGRGATVTDG